MPTVARETPSVSRLPYVPPDDAGDRVIVSRGDFDRPVVIRGDDPASRRRSAGAVILGDMPTRREGSVAP